MNNLVIPELSAVPAHLQHRLQAESPLLTAVTSGIGSGNMPRISIKGSRFRLIVDGAETVLPESVLETIIVGANPNLSKLWFKDVWEPDNDQVPNCFSFNGVSPDAESEFPQSETCKQCPHNAWGSKITPTGKKVKACADQKRLAVVAKQDPSGEIYLLQVTPSALKGLNAYQKELMHRGIPAEIVSTRISFDTEASYPRLTFSFGGFLESDTQTIVDSLFGSDKVIEITGERDTSVVVNVLAPATVLKSDEVVDISDYEVVSEPVVESNETSHGFGAAPAPAPAPVVKKTTKKRASKKAAETVESVADAVEDKKLQTSEPKGLEAQIAELLENTDDD